MIGMFALHELLLECYMLLCWSRSDGEENVGDQEFFDDQQDQHEFVNQGKYSMGLP